MTNDFQKKTGGVTVVAAIVSALVLAIAGLTAALALSLQKRYSKPNTEMAQYLLIDSSASLKSSLSAMRLCNEEEVARELANSALVYAVRAETALECENGAWSDCRCKEAFLNDVATILQTREPLDAVGLADEMYKYSVMLYEHFSTGAEFEYNGELIESADVDSPKHDRAEPSEVDIERGETLIQEVLGATVNGRVGAYNGRTEFDVERDGKQGYAVIEDGKLYEFAFSHSGGDDDNNSLDRARASDIATECAQNCGFDGLKVYSVDVRGNYALVKLCHDIDGAMCRDECASCTVVDDSAVAFTAGKCGAAHKVPKVKVTEEQARINAPDAQETGRLVTRTVGGRDRVCYEYRYELDDGVHYVYVCAESGKQMQVK